MARGTAVITSVHCKLDQSSEQMACKTGSHQLRKKQRAFTWRNAQQKIMHLYNIHRSDDRRVGFHFFIDMTNM